MSFNVIKSTLRPLSTLRRVVNSPTAVKCAQHRSYTACALLGSKPSSLYLANASARRESLLSGQSTNLLCRGLHTAGDQDLAEFLTEEIELEKKGQKTGDAPASINGFQISHNNAEIVLTSKGDNETVTLKLNINHGMEEQLPENEADDSPNNNPMLCKPPFVIEIEKGDITLSLHCGFPGPSYDPMEQSEDKYDDLIEIHEVGVYKGDFNDEVYLVSGGIIDGTIYDMLLNLMEERKMNAEFFNNLVEYCTNYEQKRYVTFLKDLQEFAKRP